MPNPRPGRSMQTQACDRCHQRKTRCDRRFPRCGACERANTPCLHTDKLNQQAYPRAYINSLEDRLHLATSEKQQLADELKELRASLAIPSPQSTHQQTPTDEGLSVDTETHSIHDSPPTTAGNVIASDSGYLNPKATGEHRYLASGSGVTLASIVTSLVGSTNLPHLTQDEHVVEGSRQTPRAAQVITALPDREASMAPLEAYFTHWHLTFPLLCRPQLMGIVDLIYGVPEYYGSHPFDAFLFDMVLAMGAVNFNRPDWSAAPAEVHYNRAMSKLEGVLSMKGLAPLRAILLLCQYTIFCSQRDTSASMWHLVGIAVRLCVEMGLHRKSKLEDSASQGMRGGRLQLDLEMRKRTFWCLYNLDRIISVTLGRPVALRDEDIDVSLPTAYDIDQLSLQELCSGVTTPELSYTSPFLHLIDIRRLAGNILQSVHCVNQDLAGREKYTIRQKLHEDLESWKAGIPSINNLQTAEGERQTSSFRLAMWYEVPYHNALLLLYRPSSTFPHMQIPAEGDTDSSAEILDRILNSARSVIHLYAKLHRTRRLNYSWITLHTIFIAGLSYVYSISRIIKEQAWNSADLPACLEYTRIINDTRECSNVLVAISERWGTTRGSCKIFDRLSTAIIEDAVNASLNNHRLNNFPTGQIGGIGNVLDGHNHSDSGFLRQNSVNTSPPQPQQDIEFMSSDCDGGMGPSMLPEPHELSAETGFRQFYQNLQSGVPASLPHDYGIVPSEVITGFSQNWFEENTDFASSNSAMDLW